MHFPRTLDLTVYFLLLGLGVPLPCPYIQISKTMVYYYLLKESHNISLFVYLVIKFK